MPPDKDTQWPEVVIAHDPLKGHGVDRLLAGHTPWEFEETERYLPISSIRERLRSKEVVLEAAKARFTFATGRSYDQESDREQTLSREIADFYISVALDAAFPDTKDKDA
jgi:hypothetical protein